MAHAALQTLSKIHPGIAYGLLAKLVPGSLAGSCARSKDRMSGRFRGLNLGRLGLATSSSTCDTSDSRSMYYADPIDVQPCNAGILDQARRYPWSNWTRQQRIMAS